MPRYRILVTAVTSALVSAMPASAGAQTERATPVTLPTITVESTRLPTDLAQVAAPVSVRQRADLDRDQAADIGDVLNRLPGVTTSGGPRTTALQPVIRGFGGERVVIRVDGARQNFAAGHRGRVFVDPFLLERAEVLRGPASSLYGSGALGGVVNFRTRDAESFLEPDETFGARVSAGYQNQGSQQLLSAIVAGRGDRTSWLGSVLQREQSDLKADDQPSITESEWSKQLTTTYTLTPGWDLFGGYSEAFRAPSLTNLYVGGVHFGNNFFEPNPDLKPEKARNKELGLSYNGRGVWQAQDRLRVDFGIDNVTDRTYRPHLSAINDPGRNVKILASYRFEERLHAPT